jgi:hypothetical protein
MHFLDVVHPKHHKLVKDNFEKVKSGEALPPYELEYRRRDGSLVFVEVNTKPIYRDGEVIGLLGVSRDITERKMIEDNLKKSEEKLRIIYNSVVDGICVLDLEINILDVNESCIKILGYESKEELLGRNPFDFLISKKHLRKASKILKEMIGRGEVGRVELDLIRKDGNVINTELSASVLRDSSGNETGYACVFRDITERKKVEEDIRKKIMKYRLEEGRVYLVKEYNSEISIEAFRDLLSVGYDGVIISRTPESELQDRIKT